MTASARVVMTGGTGLLGGALQEACRSRSDGPTTDTPAPIAPRLMPLSSRDVEVSDPASVAAVLADHRPEVLLHAAGYTDVRGAEQDRADCWRTNVTGTRVVAEAAREAGVRLVHVSTDYVFWGGDERPEGGYREDDPVGPVRNYYALSKLVAEEAARRAPSALIVRTSFRPSEWLYPVAFDDVFTSQDYVDVIADELALLLAHLPEIDDEVLHVATERKSVFELARRRTPTVRPGSKREAGVALPDDVSLNTDRWRALKGSWA